jgi:dTDP-3,4-didehydro-2,6-dideoxy-alpha-D-glucose 3-reductase
VVATAHRQLRIGVVGCADIARRRTLPAIARSPQVRLAAVASRDAGKAAAFAAEFGCDAVHGYQQLLDRADIDAVYVPLPAGLHAEWVAAALMAGKHVLSEKPCVTRFPEATRLVALARERGLLLMENFMFLHHSQHTAVRKLVADGAIGELRSLQALFGIPPLAAGDVRYRPELGGGALLDTGVYPIRLAQLFLGPSLDVAGAAARQDPDRGVDVAGSALLRAPAGQTAELAFGLEHSYRCEYTLWGSTGQLRLTRAFTPPPGWQPVVRIEQQGRVEELTLSPDDQFAGAISAFASTVLAGAGFAEHGEAILRQAGLVDRVRDQALLHG